MEEIRLTISYASWALIVGMTLGFFSCFSKKYKKLGSLIFTVLSPTWIIISIIKGVEYYYFGSSYELFSVLGFIMLLAESLPIIIIFGGTTFAIKYLKFKKTN